MTATHTGDGESITCMEVMRLVTDYLEGVMNETQEQQFEVHLQDCEGCDAYIAQMRTTIRVTGQLSPEDVDPQVRERLLEAFRSWKESPQASEGLLDKLRNRFKR